MLRETINKINLELSLYGFSVISPEENKYQRNFLEKFQNEMENIKLEDDYENEYPGGDLLEVRKKKLINAKDFGHKVHWINDKGFLQYKEFDESNKKIIDLMKNTKGYNLYSIFRTLDTKQSRHIAQNPHFDKLPTLKFMLYVNDINESNGSFCLSPGSHKWVEERFGKYRFLQKSKHYNKISREIPKSLLNRLQPINGKAGTIIIFYTNCIHHQGIVEDGCCKIVRAHYRKNLLNFKLR